MDISNAQLRRFLNDYFDGDELHDLCFDYFPRVQQEFTSGMVKSEQIRLLLTHCRNHGERDRLIGALQESRPGPFQQEFELAQPTPTPVRATAAPTSRNPRQIFISHAYEDAKLAHRLAADLGQRGWQVWIAPDSIQPGEKWVPAINRGLVESGILLLLISQDAVQSRWVNSEADIAIQWEHEGKMRFIPVQTGTRPIAHVPAMWQRHQDISFAERYQDGLAQLLAKLEKRPYVPPSPQPPKRQKVVEFFTQIPMMVWGGAGILILGVVLIAWLLSLIRDGGGGITREPEATFDGSGSETTREPEATQALGEIAVADTATPTATDQPTLTPTIATTTPTDTDVPEATETLTAEPSDTPQPPIPTHTLLPPTATNDPNIPPTNASLHDTWPRPQDGMTMVYVPGGTFTMGSSEAEIDNALELCQQYYDSCERSFFEDEAPTHEVQVSDFWLDQYEVTNSQFVLFLNEVGNQVGGEVTWLEIDSSNVLIEEVGGVFQPKEGFDAHPVMEVSWHGAGVYCFWAGGRLPTEAEWEYAARGEAGNIYPWGNEFDGTQLNYCDTNCEFDWKDETVDDGYARTAPVVSYDSQSWVGAYDLAGNVWEWTADRYGIYSSASQNNPTGPTDGAEKVLRGGSWLNYPSGVRSSHRFGNPPDVRVSFVGFRCVASPGS